MLAFCSYPPKTLSLEHDRWYPLTHFHSFAAEGVSYNTERIYQMYSDYTRIELILISSNIHLLEGPICKYDHSNLFLKH